MSMDDGVEIAPTFGTQRWAWIVAHDGACARDVVALARRVQGAVEERFGIRLTPEPVYWGAP